ncbi:MAG TPA: hypothetical protein DCW74_17915 [Alteromonas australica]|jgi:hypothetical protein|uniref:Uncharacterized protein n=1 Tax=Alteromonas australica TaxID=589873 RepID=A0A350P8H9_9ALTE|nr:MULTISPECIES: hypothetical protein [Gammaproteobacteria]MBU32931.1 hypothetical protein [Alteromonas sp.]HAD89808.1 hypothetical protein [Alteromonas macleodii]HAU28212.1 hypothetical protein [Alteromonas australica]HAW77596.1 hypothetical protein [Alteromonas australica]HBU51621.1 hypothetical protein [Alteromonas australica]|tara:strand:- start:3581 stop:4054 length:474 start_codon:yes stop_codon:yes gene_type:complete
MDKWTSLNTSQLAHEVARDSVFNAPYEGEIVFSLPPHDVPNAMRVYIDEVNAHVLVVEFKYGAVNERWAKKSPRKGIDFFVGIKTGRIHRVELNGELLPTGNSFKLDDSHLDPLGFRRAIESLLGAEPKLSQYEEKYKANTSAIKQFNEIAYEELTH